MAQSIDSVVAHAAQLTAAGQPEAAIGVLRPALSERPEHPGAWCQLSAACLDAGRPIESLDAAKRAIVLGERSWAHRLASLALVELGRYEEAVISAREAVRRDPDDWRGHVALAESLGPVAPQAAVEVARAAVALAPEQARPHEVLGDAAARVRNLALARQAYQDAIHVDPTDQHLRANLGRLGRARISTVPRASSSLGGSARPARFGRVQRRALWLALRRVSTWLVVGTLLLIIAGMPGTSGALAWFGLALVALTLGVAGHGWLGLPEGARVTPRVLHGDEPLAAAVTVLIGAATVMVLAWTVAVALGSNPLRLLSLALICSVVANLTGWLGVRRLRIPKH